MTLQLFGHPLSSYHQKAAIALYENGAGFDLRMLDGDHPDNLAAVQRASPAGKFPVLLDGDAAIIEATVIIEYLDCKHAGPAPLIPADVDAAIEARMMDRIFDNYVMTPMQKFGADAMRPTDAKDPAGVADARAMLDRSYRWLDARLTGRTWAAGETFGLADCAAAPALFYADWAHPIAADHEALRAYLARLQKRASVARAAAEAEPYLHMVPLPPRGDRGEPHA